MSNNASAGTPSSTEDGKKGLRSRVRPVFGRGRNIMPVDGVPKGYQHRWINDVEDRIAKKGKEGWDFLCSGGKVVVGDVGINTAKQSGSVVSMNVGGGITAYCMVIKNEFMREDRKAYHNQVSIVKESIDKEGQGKKGFYGGVTVT